MTNELHRGFFIIEEEAIRHLKRKFADPTAYRKAMGAYITLVRLANLKGSMTFSERIGSIADDMGFSYCEALKAIKLVEIAGLVSIETRFIPGTKEKDLSTYTVKRMLYENPLRLDENKITSDGFPLRLEESASLCGIPESTQEPPQERTKVLPQERMGAKAPKPKVVQPRFVPPTLQQAQTEAVKHDLPESEAKLFIAYHQAREWRLGRGLLMKNWKAAMVTWAGNYQKFDQRRANPARNSKPVLEMPDKITKENAM